MTKSSKKTLRLIMPQWQGGNLPAYHFGAELLAWLAPAPSGPVATVAVDDPTELKLPLEEGIIGRAALLRQADEAMEVLKAHAPDKVVVLGGDCLVDLAPFAYLNERYDGNLAVLWVDSHPDVMTPRHFPHAHAMVLGNLMGEGDKDFVSRVSRPIKAANIMYAGLFDMTPVERAFVDKHDLRVATPTELSISSEPVIEWLRSSGARHLAIHLDLDVLDPAEFRSLLFANPTDAPGRWGSIPQGRMSIDQVLRLLRDVANVVEIVGIGIAEHLPWDALAMKKILQSLPLIAESAE